MYVTTCMYLGMFVCIRNIYEYGIHVYYIIYGVINSTKDSTHYYFRKHKYF